MRDESVAGIVPIFKEKIVKKVAPMQISVLVLNPAGLSYSSRSQPMTPPKTSASKSLNRYSAVTSVLFNNTKYSTPAKPVEHLASYHLTRLTNPRLIHGT